MIKTAVINVNGIVQGVGFRPFVYSLALELNLTGFVNNDDMGVNITVQGKDEDIKIFLHKLESKTPPLSRIDKITTNFIIDSEIYNNFQITKSLSTSNKTTIISPDTAVCQDCVDEMNSKDNYRFEYPLINCTNCGPRYSIINTIPYDRAYTSMNKFVMCEKCQEEYEDPTNRRYHAQPISCSLCGPKISLYDKNNELLLENNEAIKEMATLINSGKIVAIKGLGGFHLICDASNDLVVNELRVRKNRPTKPFAVMFDNISTVLLLNLSFSIKMLPIRSIFFILSAATPLGITGYNSLVFRDFRSIVAICNAFLVLFFPEIPEFHVYFLILFYIYFELNNGDLKNA